MRADSPRAAGRRTVPFDRLDSLLRKDSTMATKTAPKAAKAPKAVKAAKPVKIVPAGPKGRSKGETLNTLAGFTGLSRKQVASVIEGITEIIKNDLGKKGPGVFKFNGLLKLTTVNKPATKARMGRNPFTGEEQMIKAKPASRKVRARALKALNGMI
jgi:nucleoid DNA-binding protein